MLTSLTEGIGYFTVADAVDGTPTTVIHIGGKPVPKPWHPAARRRVRSDAYVRLLRRLLHADDVELRRDFRAVVARRLPRPLYLWLRRGWRARRAN